MTPAEIVLAFQEGAEGRDDAAFDLVAEDLIQHATGLQGRNGLRQTLATLANDLDFPDFIHIWRVEDGLIAEHWACRDDVGLLAQVGGWPPR